MICVYEYHINLICRFNVDQSYLSPSYASGRAAPLDGLQVLSEPLLHSLRILSQWLCEAVEALGELSALGLGLHAHRGGGRRGGLDAIPAAPGGQKEVLRELKRAK